MESLVSLEGYDPDLIEYLLKHKFPAVLEVRLAIWETMAFAGRVGHRQVMLMDVSCRRSSRALWS